ncbi:arsenate-mycothiol transferase ArsC [Acidihalobacter prosperus]|uniref:Phosphotyrosine protein phosphatase I domain-containing protein n=1 Tax=Acidihalobacter prosperus TaxID=160660 RepID=A0A1A6C1B4_9GAMM|nr:arsenate reductase ArsC [Acidihalobacter prosperus]OBS08357.1 hypothetical protein Thpro_022607 [Acidihalobacter prosperus]
MRGDASPNFRRKPHILIVDAHNADRSQMAEAFMRQQAGDLLEVASAGMHSMPLDRRTVQVMEEVGLDIRRQEEKLVSRERLLWADVIIVIDDPAETLHAAVPPNATEKRWLITKPRPQDDDEDALAAYRATRDEVRQRVESMVKSLRLFYGRSRSSSA